LQRAQVIQSAVVISVDRNPLTSLRLRIDRIEPNRQPSFEVCPDGRLIQRLRRSERRTRSLIRQELFRQKIVVAARVGVGPLGLNRVGTPVHEQCPVIPDVLRSSPDTATHRNNLAKRNTFSSTRVDTRFTRPMQTRFRAALARTCSSIAFSAAAPDRSAGTA